MYAIRFSFDILDMNYIKAIFPFFNICMSVQISVILCFVTTVMQLETMFQIASVFGMMQKSTYLIYNRVCLQDCYHHPLERIFGEARLSEM